MFNRFNRHDLDRDGFMLTGELANEGYDWWWHSFTAHHAETGEERAFFIEFFTCNPALGGPEPVYGQLPENRGKGIKPSYLMVKAGCWGEGHCQVHRFFGWDSVTVTTATPYSITAADCYASDFELRGSVSVSEAEAAAHPEYMSDAGSLQWNLTVSKQVAFNVGYGAGGLFRRLEAFEMYWNAEGMKSAFEGTITWNGEVYLVRPEDCYGYADKNWGRGFTSPWVWLSSNNLVSNLTGKQLEDSVFDIGGGRPKIYHLALDRKLLGAFWYEGQALEFNFSKFWTHTETEFECEETDTRILWHVRQENLLHIMETEVSCEKKDMLLVNYEAPDGSKRHNRLWNGGNGVGNIRLYRKGIGEPELVDDISVKNIGCEYGEYDPLP